MRQTLTYNDFLLKLDAELEMYHVYQHNHRCAVIYYDAGTIRFTSTEDLFDMDELNDLRDLVCKLYTEYEIEYQENQ